MGLTGIAAYNGVPPTMAHGYTVCQRKTSYIDGGYPRLSSYANGGYTA